MSLLHDGADDDLIPAAAVDELLRTVRVGLEHLEVELQQAQLEVLQLEAELAARADLGPDDERIEAARTAVEAVALGAQEHLARELASAHAHAEARIAAAEAEALGIVQAAREVVARRLVEPLGVGDPLPSPDTDVPLRPDPSARDELTGWAAPEVPTAATDLHHVPEAPPVADLVAEGPAERLFWADEPASPRRPQPSPDLAIALLPMAAIVIVLVAVLLLIG